MERHLAERAAAPRLALFEVYQGEVYRSGPADFDAVDAALGWLTVEDDPDAARAAAELQAALRDRGEPLAARDAFVAGTASALDEPLAVADAAFDVAGAPTCVTSTSSDRDCPSRGRSVAVR